MQLQQTARELHHPQEGRGGEGEQLREREGVLEGGGYDLRAVMSGVDRKYCEWSGFKVLTFLFPFPLFCE